MCGVCPSVASLEYDVVSCVIVVKIGFTNWLGFGVLASVWWLVGCGWTRERGESRTSALA
jgi:hypothetical protein